MVSTRPPTSKSNSFLDFSHQPLPMVSHWSLSDSKSPQVSGILLSILAVFNNTVVWMVSTRPPTSKSNSFLDFSHQPLPMVSHWSLSDSKSPQVSGILLSILTDINNAVVWMVPTHPVNSKSSSLCINPLMTLQTHQLQWLSP